jgi:hypothetical protein
MRNAYKTMSKMVIKKECLCNLSKMIFWADLILFFTNCTKWRMQPTIYGGRNSHAIFKWAWKGNGLKLLAPITSNKNGQWSTKNLIMIIGATSAQFPKQATNAMNFVKMKLIPPWKMGREACWYTKRTCGQSQEPKPRTFMRSCQRNQIDVERLVKGESKK